MRHSLADCQGNRGVLKGKSRVLGYSVWEPVSPVG